MPGRMDTTVTLEPVASEIGVRSGQAIALRLFDIAYEIDLPHIERLRSERAQVSRRARLSMAPRKAIAFGVPPVVLPLELVTIRIGGVETTLSASARLYEFGVVALSLRVDIVETPWSGFIALVNGLDRALGDATDGLVWETMLARLLGEIAPALSRPVEGARLWEDYVLGVVNSFDRACPAARIGLPAAEGLDLIPLLSGETRPLAAAAREELLAHRFSYYEDDLVVLGWDRAFIYEPRGDNDVADVLEVANAQLLEMRYYDELLDDELPRMYDLVESTRRAVNLLAPSRFASLARRLYTLVAEVTELTEKVDNALQVTEDVYLARIYESALAVFRVPQVSAAVDRKLAIIRDTYAALYDEASSSRTGLLEILVTLLISVEIILALTRHG